MLDGQEYSRVQHSVLEDERSEVGTERGGYREKWPSPLPSSQKIPHENVVRAPES